MNSEISNHISSLQNSSKDVRDLFSSLSDEQLNWKPNDKKWSVGECIEHLLVTNKTYFPQLEEITAGKHNNSFWQSFSPFSGFFGKMLIKTVSPDNVKKTKTAVVFTPKSSRVHKSIISDFEQTNDKLISYMRGIEGDLSKTKIYSPVGKFITYSLANALTILTIHETRHINQAKAVMKTEGFPK
jgi:hypothetical protein